jgi:hypothetical protein
MIMQPHQNISIIIRIPMMHPLSTETYYES